MSELKTNLEQILQEKNEKIISQNIKKDIEVLGVTGSYDKEDIKELQDELADAEQELADVRRDLDNSTATISGSGENVTLSGTAEARFKKAPLPLGNTEQVQYSGKNKIISFKTRSSDFIEYFFDKSINNSFIMSGLSNLTVSGFKVTIKTSNGDVNLGYKNIETNKNFSFTFSITTDDLSKIQNSTSTPFIQFWSSNGFTEADFKNVMIRDSSITDDTYEPYVGGQASPNPDYPQEITNVTGDVEVKVQNKNLFNKDNIKTIDYYIQPIAPNPGEHIYSLNNRNCEIEVEPNTDYIRNIVKVNNMTFWSSITFYDKDHAFISGLWSPDNIITTPSNAKYMILSTSGNVSSLFGDEFVLETYYNSLQLEKGTTLTNYVEHKEQLLPLALKSKNLFDKNNATILNAYILKDTITANSANRIFYLKVKPNTTYAITKYKSYYFTVGCVDKIPEVGDTVTNIQSGPDNYKYDGSKGFLIYTTNATAQYIVCRFYQTSLDTGVSLNDMLGSIQVEEGSTATDYEPYYNYELCKIENYQDYFWKDEIANKWYLHKEIGLVVLDGSEQWYIGTYAPANSVQFLTPKPNNFFIETGTEGLAKIKSSHFINQDKVNGMRIGYNIAFFPSNSYNITTVEDFKAWLSAHNVTLEYTLKTPTDTEITDVTLISQLEAIRKAISYDEQTNISSNTIALFDIIALRNMNDTLNTLENEIELLP